jgi:hypothetical protein
VTSGFPQDGGLPGPASEVGEEVPLILELTLAAGDPVRGTVGVLGEPPALPFCGWIDLMSAINSLRASGG